MINFPNILRALQLLYDSQCIYAGRCESKALILMMSFISVSGAHEPPKECATRARPQVPLQSIVEMTSILGQRTLIHTLCAAIASRDRGVEHTTTPHATYMYVTSVNTS